MGWSRRTSAAAVLGTAVLVGLAVLAVPPPAALVAVVLGASTAAVLTSRDVRLGPLPVGTVPLAVGYAVGVELATLGVDGTLRAGLLLVELALLAVAVWGLVAWALGWPARALASPSP